MKLLQSKYFWILSTMTTVLFVFCQISFSQESKKSEEFKASGKVWGYTFGDFYYKNAGDTATWSSKSEYSGVAKDIYAFAFRRMYLGYDYNISPAFSTTVLLEGGDGVLTPKGDRTVFIKALNVQWKNIYKRGNLLIGQIPTPTWSLITEKIWNYRSIEKTIADVQGIGRSNDVGVALFGTFDSTGNYGYNLMYGNGTGSKPEILTSEGRLKVYYGELYAYFLKKKIIVEVYTDYQAGLNDKSIVTYKGFVAYQSAPITAGVEFVSQKQNKYKSDKTDVTPFGISVWARGSITKDKLNAFARFDSYNPDRNYSEKDTIKLWNPTAMYKQYNERFIVAGFDYTPHKNVHIMPNVYINSYDAKRETNLIVKRKTDVTLRLTFYFIFR